ncbi:MAG TPA: hypothetical protein VG965_06995 [Patescibacteria group bacterium]|nr:hypothetical protein [Patescibacteria group bacterium]
MVGAREGEDFIGIDFGVSHDLSHPGSYTPRLETFNAGANIMRLYAQKEVSDAEMFGAVMDSAVSLHRANTLREGNEAPSGYDTPWVDQRVDKYGGISLLAQGDEGMTLEDKDIQIAAFGYGGIEAHYQFWRNSDNEVETFITKDFVNGPLKRYEMPQILRKKLLRDMFYAIDNNALGGPDYTSVHRP